MRIRAPTPQLDEARRRLADALQSDDPLLLEDKGAALVLHYRTHPEERARAERLAERAAGGLADLQALRGHAIVEIRERGVTKAVALRLFSDVPAFAGRLPVFVGDDTTDEDGFAAAAQAGGFGVKVGPGDTAAEWRLPDVTGVHRWLAALA
jgi:trehalose 6-phosphate phosphatase